MTVTRSRVGASRAVSVVSSATVRDTLKRRNKPYKTEQKKIIGKKRKLALQVRHVKMSDVEAAADSRFHRRLMQNTRPLDLHFFLLAPLNLLSCAKSSHDSAI
jgi:hypothetical protein